MNKYKAEVLEHLSSWNITMPTPSAQSGTRRGDKASRSADSGGRVNAPTSGRGGLSQRTRDVISKAKGQGQPPAVLSSAPSSNESTTSTSSVSSATLPPGPKMKKSRSAVKLRTMNETQPVSGNEEADDIYHRLIQPFAQVQRPSSQQSGQLSDGYSSAPNGQGSSSSLALPTAITRSSSLPSSSTQNKTATDLERAVSHDPSKPKTTPGNVPTRGDSLLEMQQSDSWMDSNITQNMTQPETFRMPSNDSSVE